MITSLAGLTPATLPEPQRKTIVAGLTQVVLLRLVDELSKALIDEDRKKVEEMVENNSSEVVLFDFLKSRFPNFDQRVTKIVEEEKIELDQKLQQLLKLINSKK